MSKETEKLKQQMLLQHKRPQVDDIIASFMRPSPALQSVPASEAASPEPAAEEQPVSAPEPTGASVPVEASEAEPEPDLRLHQETPPAPARPAHARKPKRKAPPKPVTSSKPLVSNIPQRAFFKYYNTCQDQILSRIPSKTGKLIFNRLFRLSYGFNRNWCRVSLVSMAKHVGANQINHVLALLRGELSEWVSLAAKGGRQGPSLWVLDLGDNVPRPWEIESVKIVSIEEAFEEGKEVDRIN